jgi:RNA polymerase sigma-70 factor (ECF subfamily)
MSKRKKPYEFRFEGEGANRRIYARFRDYYHHPQEVEVTEELHLELVLLNRSVRNIESSEERHEEHRDLTDEEQALRGAPVAPSAEDEAINSFLIEELKSAFMQLPAVQARRYLLAHVAGFTYAEIAQMEGCSRNAVKHSLVIARKNLKEILAGRLPITPSEFGSKREVLPSLAQFDNRIPIHQARSRHRGRDAPSLVRWPHDDAGEYGKEQSLLHSPAKRNYRPPRDPVCNR